MTKPDMVLFKGGTRIPECGICAGTLRQDDAGWYCEKCGLRYKFVARYRDEEAQARSRASVQKLTDATKVLLEGFQRLNCQNCRDALNPLHMSFGVECVRHKKAPSA